MINKALKGPSSGVMNKALEFMTAFGDAKGLKSLLTEMKEVQVHNEKVLSEIHVAARELEARKKLGIEASLSLQAKHMEFQQEKTAYHYFVDAESGKLRKMRTDNRATQDAKMRELMDREKKVSTSEGNCRSQEKAFQYQRNLAHIDSKHLEQRVADFKLKFRKLESIFEQLKLLS